jgi:hypothetical protein
MYPKVSRAHEECLVHVFRLHKRPRAVLCGQRPIGWFEVNFFDTELVYLGCNIGPVIDYKIFAFMLSEDNDDEAGGDKVLTQITIPTRHPVRISGKVSASAAD